MLIPPKKLRICALILSVSFCTKALMSGRDYKETVVGCVDERLKHENLLVYKLW